MRVAQLTATFPPYLGGAGTVCQGLSRELAARGHDVEVITATADGPDPETGGARLRRLEPRFAIGNAPLLPEIAKLGGFDVLHLHYPFIFGAELTLLARRRNPETALVVSYHNRLIGEGGRALLFRVYEETCARALVRSADRVAVVSRAHAETVPYLDRLLEREPERIAELPNGVETDHFQPGPDRSGLRDRLGIPPDAPVACFIATLDRAHYLKRADLAIEGVARARTDVHLVVAGGGEWEARFRRHARDSGIGERVHFLGAVPHAELPDLLRGSDFMLLTSDLESFGIVLIEAMACGIPTISTDLPGVLAVVRPGETGLVARRGEATAIAAAIDEMAAMDPERRHAMGSAGRSLCEGRYAWPRLAEQLEVIYTEALARRRSTPDHRS